MGDAIVDQASQAFQKLDARVAKVVASGFAPHVLHDRDRGGAEETAGAVGVRLLLSGAGIFRHWKSPSSQRSVSYSPTLHEWAKGPPSKSAGRYAAAAFRSRPPARRLS